MKKNMRLWIFAFNVLSSICVFGSERESFSNSTNVKLRETLVFRKKLQTQLAKAQEEFLESLEAAIDLQVELHQTRKKFVQSTGELIAFYLKNPKLTHQDLKNISAFIEEKISFKEKTT